MSIALDQAEAYLSPRMPMGRRKRAALRAVLQNWSTFDRDSWTDREEARKAIYDGSYGSVILVLVIVTIAEATLTWIVERILDRLFPRESSGMMADDCWQKMSDLSAALSNE